MGPDAEEGLPARGAGLRATGNVNGRVLMYADKETDAMQAAMRNRPPPGDPARLQRGARDYAGDRAQGHLGDERVPGNEDRAPRKRRGKSQRFADPDELERTIVTLEEEILHGRFEEAARLRDELKELRRDLDGMRAGA